MGDVVDFVIKINLHSAWNIQNCLQILKVLIGFLEMKDRSEKF
jgi:hypothetical protein